MSNIPATNTVKDLFRSEAVKKRFQELLGEKANAFGTSVLQVVNGNNLLINATPESVLNAAIMAAALDLPINNNLGFAWIVPYKTKVNEAGRWVEKVVAQFQLGWKGYVQLAQRTGQYKNINAVAVYANQFKSFNRLTEELEADFTVEGLGDIVGFAAHFSTITGFSKTVYWSAPELKAHGKRFSKSYEQKNGVWETNFESMGLKTVVKNMIAKWGIMSIDMQKAVISDQAVINDADTMDVTYVDNEPAQIETEKPEFTELHFDQAIEAGADIHLIRAGYTTTPDIEQQFEAYAAAKK